MNNDFTKIAIYFTVSNTAWVKFTLQQTIKFYIWILGKVKHTIETLITNHCTLGNAYKSHGSRYIAHFDISCITIQTWPLLRTRIGKMAISAEF